MYFICKSGFSAFVGFGLQLAQQANQTGQKSLARLPLA
jgi:hypothetical protein